MGRLFRWRQDRSTLLFADRGQLKRLALLLQRHAGAQAFRGKQRHESPSVAADSELGSQSPARPRRARSSAVNTLPGTWRATDSAVLPGPFEQVRIAQATDGFVAVK